MQNESLQLGIAIQTVLPEKEILLFQTSANSIQVLSHQKWLSTNDELATIFPKLQQILSPFLPNPDLKSIICADGLGPYSSTRIGVTIANSLTVERPDTKLFSFTLVNSPEQITANQTCPILTTEYTGLEQVVQKIILENHLPKILIEPLYTAPPNITPSKKPRFF